MLRNTYMILYDIVDTIKVVDRVYLNGKELTTDQLIMIATNKELFQDLTHIDDIQYHYSTDEQYGWIDYYISNSWIPKPANK